MSVEERVTALESRCNRMRKQLVFHGIAIIIIGIYTTILLLVK